MLVYTPTKLRAGAPLVVVLHGCGQDAAAFAVESGWIAMATQYGFALLLPEQIYENNRARCFNWFRPEDVRRGGGEAMSIRQMIRASMLRFGSDPKRVFVAGFSAGGAMAVAMLAAYPAIFAGGAAVAGMPAGCAATPMAAMLHMHRADTSRSRAGLAGDVRTVTAAKSRRYWPRLSIWHGARDRTVDPANANMLAAQWSELHGHSALPTHDETTTGIRRRSWVHPNRATSVDLWTLTEIGHGFPVNPHTHASGHTGPWVVDAGLSAAREIVAFWSLDASAAQRYRANQI
jgi:poly(hydroxyalkanoate) depolymerase family esterase